MTQCDNEDEAPPIRPLIGVSRCLLGDAVRYDGGSNRVPWITDVLSSHCDFQAVCPEIEAGLGVPRPMIRLQGTPARPRALLQMLPVRDVTNGIAAASENLLAGIGNLDGLILKAHSPSCGPVQVPVIETSGQVAPGVGLFASACRAKWPRLPIIDETGLVSEAGRVAFLIGVFRYHCRQHLPLH